MKKVVIIAPTYNEKGEKRHTRTKPKYWKYILENLPKDKKIRDYVKYFCKHCKKKRGHKREINNQFNILICLKCSHKKIQSHF